jgi:hypothetical protein
MQELTFFFNQTIILRIKFFAKKQMFTNYYCRSITIYCKKLFAIRF